MIDLAESWLKESRSGTRKRSAGNLLERTLYMGEMNICSNRLMYESVYKKENACGECKL